MSERLPAHLEVSALIRLVASHGGNAMVLAKGEGDAGTVLIVTMFRGGAARLFRKNAATRWYATIHCYEITRH